MNMSIKNYIKEDKRGCEKKDFVTNWREIIQFHYKNLFSNNLNS